MNTRYNLTFLYYFLFFDASALLKTNSKWPKGKRFSIYASHTFLNKATFPKQ